MNEIEKRDVLERRIKRDGGSRDEIMIREERDGNEKERWEDG